MTDPYEDDIWPAPWILPTRHVPATPDAVEAENGSTDTGTTPDAATGVSRAQRDAELWAYDELSREAAALRAEVKRLEAEVASRRAIIRKHDVARVDGDLVEGERLRVAESALRQVRELAERDPGANPDRSWVTLTDLRAALDSARVGAADTQDEGAGDQPECVCGDGDGVGFCFGIPGHADECAACLALPPSAPCLAHDTNGATP